MPWSKAGIYWAITIIEEYELLKRNAVTATTATAIINTRKLPSFLDFI